MQPSHPIDEEAALEQAARHCREKGVIFTTIRRNVLRHLLQQPGGIKAYDLLDDIKAEHPAITAPTIYRTLTFLIEQGLAHRIGKTNQFMVCAHTHHRDPCLFLVCPSCSEATEIQNTALLENLKQCVAAADHVLSGREIEVMALCQACATHKK